jgi:hypothetical protein
MIAINTTIEELQRALDLVNTKYADNIVFKNTSPVGRRIRFTLTVKDSAAAGGRLSYKLDGGTRRVSAASWHVHGEFFDALFTIQPKAIVRSAGGGVKMEIYRDSETGVVRENWQDWLYNKRLRIWMINCCKCEGEVRT